MSSKIILFALALICFLYSGSESAAIETDSVIPGAEIAENVADKAVGAVGGAVGGFGQGALQGASGTQSGESEIHRSRRQLPNPAAAIQQATGIFGNIADKTVGAFGGAFSGFGQGVLHGTSGAVQRGKRQIPNPAAAIQQAAGLFGNIADKTVGAFGGAFSGFGQGVLHGTSGTTQLNRIKRQLPNPAAAIQQASSIIPGAGIFGQFADKAAGAVGGAFSGFGEGALHGTSGVGSTGSGSHRVKRQIPPQIPNAIASVQQVTQKQVQQGVGSPLNGIPGAGIVSSLADKTVGAFGGAFSGFGQGILNGSGGLTRRSVKEE